MYIYMWFRGFLICCRLSLGTSVPICFRITSLVWLPCQGLNAANAACQRAESELKVFQTDRQTYK